MSGFFKSFKDEVRRLARREARQMGAALRRSISQLRREVAGIRRNVPRRASAVIQSASMATLPDGLRFSARSVRAQRARLGISAADFGRLVGVSALTIYHWESGMAKPRRKQLASFAGVRGIEKSEAFDRLGINPSELGRHGRRRGRKVHH